MGQEIFRVTVKANFRSRTETANFVRTVEEYLTPKVGSEIAFDCSVEYEADERYRKELSRAEAV